MFSNAHWKDGISAQRGFTLRQMRNILFYFLTIRVAVHIVVIYTLDKFSSVPVVWNVTYENETSRLNSRQFTHLWFGYDYKMYLRIII